MKFVDSLLVLCLRYLLVTNTQVAYEETRQCLVSQCFLVSVEGKCLGKTVRKVTYVNLGVKETRLYKMLFYYVRINVLTVYRYYNVFTVENQGTLM